MHAARLAGIGIGIATALAGAGCRPRLASFPATAAPGATVYFVPVRERVVALTFDDGPSVSATALILDALKERRAPAAFFLVGQNVERLPELARRIAAEGHLIGNHTYGHSRFDQSTASEVAADIDAGRRAIEAATGVTPAWFRPPFGINGPGMEDACRAQVQVIVGWSADANDWNPHPVENLVARIIEQVVPGDIILLHDGWETRPDADRRRTAAAVPLILDALAERGFRCVSLPDLLQAAGPPLAEFQNGVRLLGWQAPAKPLAPGERFIVRYFWDSPLNRLPPDCKAFVHFTTPDGALRFQSDHAIPPPGDVRDRVQRCQLMIPRNAPAGRYETRIGLFDPRHPERAARIPVRARLRTRARAVIAPAPFEVRKP